MPEDNGSVNFHCVSDLTLYKDAVLFKPGHLIAEVETKIFGKTVVASLMVRGKTTIIYKNRPFRSVEEFPESLKTLIRTSPNWEQDEDVYVDERSRFEMYCWGNTEVRAFPHDLSDMTPEQVYEEMISMLRDMYCPAEKKSTVLRDVSTSSLVAELLKRTDVDDTDREKLLKHIAES